MNNQHKKSAISAGPTTNNDQQQAESSFLHFDLLTINDRKSSLYDSQFCFQDQQIDCCFPTLGKPHSQNCKKTKNAGKQGRFITKKQKEGNDERKASVNRKRKISFLQNRIEQLQRQIAALRRNEHICVNCNQKLPGYYRQKITQIIQPEQPARSVAGDFDSKRISKDTLQFERVDFHSPLMQTQEMEEKMWIFLGTMLIAMGSKIMDFDGTFNTFRILKQSVDQMRRQVQKGQKNLGIDFFCCKQQLNEPNHVIDGVNFDPFYSNKQEFVQSHFTLEGVKLQSVQEYELFYDYKYHYCIQYDALLTIMEYARDHCTLS